MSKPPLAETKTLLMAAQKNLESLFRAKNKMEYQSCIPFLEVQLSKYTKKKTPSTHKHLGQ
jgi:hypothetical protein